MESSKNFAVDILQPPTLWINRHCYRVLFPSSCSTLGGNYVEDDCYLDTAYKDEMECELDFDIPFERLTGGKIRMSLAVASTYLPFIIGSKGATKHRIENDTHTQIKIPSKGQVGDVVIVGKDLKTVRQARIKIEILVDQAKKKQPFTHFVSIPFNHEPIQETFLKFKSAVLESCGADRGVEATLFQNPAKLHLTLCVMVLVDDRERQEAVQALRHCTSQIMNEYIVGQPLRVEVKGVEYMNDDPAEVDVLYGCVQTTFWKDSLQDMADHIVKKLIKAGVASKQYEKVKLHITLMNTLFRSDKDETEAEGTREKNRETFDARRILKYFKDFQFGEAEVCEIHLSVRHSTANDCYYSSSCKISLLPT